MENFWGLPTLASLYHKTANIQKAPSVDSLKTGTRLWIWAEWADILWKSNKSSSMNYLTPNDLDNLIRLIEDNNQYNDDEDKEFWNDILIRLNQTYRHCLDDSF